VTEIILSRIPWTLFIVSVSLFLSSLTGIVFGSISAWFRNKTVDPVLYFMMIVFTEIPAFLLGVFFLFILAARLRWFPLSGGITPFARFHGHAELLGDLLRPAALPVATLTFTRMGEFYLLSRNSMITVLTKNYIATARAKGLKRRRILFRHALRNAMPPVVARIFMSLGMLFGGSVLVENVFNYPGIGRLMRDAVIVRDYVLIQGIFFFITIAVLLMNLLADLVYRRLDPRLRKA
jgi:peptide/nickel transport system permease protein